MSFHQTGFRTFLNGSPGIMFRLLERWNMIGNGQSAFRPIWMISCSDKGRGSFFRTAMVQSRIGSEKLKIKGAVGLSN